MGRLTKSKLRLCLCCFLNFKVRIFRQNPFLWGCQFLTFYLKETHMHTWINLKHPPKSTSAAEHERDVSNNASLEGEWRLGCGLVERVWGWSRGLDLHVWSMSHNTKQCKHVLTNLEKHYLKMTPQTVYGPVKCGNQTKWKRFLQRLLDATAGDGKRLEH